MYLQGMTVLALGVQLRYEAYTILHKADVLRGWREWKGRCKERAIACNYTI